MAVPSNTYLTTAAVGIREDLHNLLYVISPSDTMFSSKIGKRGADNTKVEWLTDSLRASAQNKRLRGDDRTPTAVTAATRLYNNCQVQSESFKVDDSLKAVKSAADVTSEEYLTAKFMKDLAGDVEWAFLREARVDGTASVAPAMRGALLWVTTNLNKASDATLTASGAVTGGTSRAFTAAIATNTLQTMWAAGAKGKYTGYCGGFQKSQVSSWGDTGNYRIPVEGKKINDAIDVFFGDFGTVTFVPHRTMPTDVVFFCDHEYWKKATLRPTKKKKASPDSNLGDYTAVDITVDHTLMALNEAANGRITNLTTS